MSYVQLDTNLDAGSMLQDFYDFMAVHFPSWSPAASNLETVLAEGLSSLAGETLDLAVDVPDEIFMQFGKTIVNIPPLEAAPAAGTTTWTAIDSAGHTVPAGTQVAIADAAGELHVFEVNVDVVIPNGSSSTSAGAVALTAILDGVDANGLTATPEVLDSLAWVSTVALVGTTANGADAEDPVTYRDRLASELQLMAPRPILPDDFAALVRDNIVGVSRAVAVDGYDPADHPTYDPANPATWKERMVTIVGVDAAGAALSSGKKTEIRNYLDAKREVNFVINTDDPTSTGIDVTYQAKAYPTFDTTALRNAINQALTDYLSPINWGKPTTGDDPTAWLNATKVRYLEIAEVINRVDGVNYIEALTIRKVGGTLGTTDLTLTGVAPLTTVGTLTGTVD